jgi:hypothetical protein
MLSSTSNLSINQQQATAATKRKEDAVTAMAQVTVVDATRKALDETHVSECVTALAWDKKKTISRHME